MLKVTLSITICIFVTLVLSNSSRILTVPGKSEEVKKSGSSLDISFDDYIIKFQKVYADEQEKLKRGEIFSSNVKKLKDSKCKACGITKFTDQTQAQIQQLRGIHIEESPSDILMVSAAAPAVSSSSEPTTNSSNSSIPLSFDWRDYGVVTSIKNQQKCGVCWAFSTCGFFQSQLIRRGQAKSTIDLAEQYLFQCDYGSNGCKGGNLYTAMDLSLSTGIPFESSYPYNPSFGYPGICTIARGPSFPFTRRVTLYNLNDSQIITNLLQRPLNIGIKSNGWENYAPTDEDRTFQCGQIKKGMAEFNHAVLLIGYTETEWIIKNQWGTDWGVDGYIYISRDKKANCGIGLEINTLNNKLTPVVISSNNTTSNTSSNTTSNSSTTDTTQTKNPTQKNELTREENTQTQPNRFHQINNQTYEGNDTEANYTQYDNSTEYNVTQYSNFN